MVQFSRAESVWLSPDRNEASKTSGETLRISAS